MMGTLFVALISVLSPLLYIAVAAVSSGLTYRAELHACKGPHPDHVRYPDIYTSPHKDHYHKTIAFWVGAMWPVGWAWLLAKHTAALPTAEDRIKAQVLRIAQLEKELGIGQ